MIHVSATCNPHFHSTGSHYLGADTTAFMQAMTSGLFRDFPTMRWIIPHGGGAVPYHWGRFKGMAEENGKNGWMLLDDLMDNVFFDTCVYHQPGIDLLVDVVPTSNILFASEMVGAVKGKNPDTGEYYDDTKLYVDRADLTDEQRSMIFEQNVQRVYPRLEIPRVSAPQACRRPPHRPRRLGGGRGARPDRHRDGARGDRAGRVTSGRICGRSSATFGSAGRRSPCSATPATT